MTQHVGALKDLSAIELGAIASRGAFQRTGTRPEWIDHVVFGNVQQSSVDAHYGARHVGLKAGGKIGSHALPDYDLFQWGGFLMQSGYAPGQLLGGNLLFGRALYYHRIMRGSLLEGAYAGLSLEVGRVGNPLVASNSSATLKSGSLFIAADSPLGPAYLGYGRSTDGTANFYFFVGRPF
jgi:NTE family protein